MDVLISADIEGIVGINDRTDIELDSSKYHESRELMTKEVNAAIKGCEGLCENIYVVDGHGAGNNLLREKLIDDAILLNRSKDLKMMTGVEKVDAVLFIGYHGMAGKKNSFCAHTNSTRLVKSLIINGKEVNEAHTNALIGKFYGVKTVFISGTDKGVQETKKIIRNIYSVVNKESVSFTTAVSRPVQKNLEEIRQRVRESLKNKEKVKMISGSVYNTEFIIELNEPLGVIDFEDEVKISSNRQKISFTKPHILEAYRVYRKVLEMFV